jgi:hypothetical protein
MSFCRIAARLVLASLILSPLPNPAIAQDASPHFTLDLNAAAETDAGACRLTYVASNQSDTALDRVAYEVAVFDAEGVVTRLLALEFGGLIAGKTKVLQFELAGTPCAGLSRIVVNGIVACTATGGAASDVCMSGLVASSRTAIQFGL